MLFRSSRNWCTIAFQREKRHEDYRGRGPTTAASEFDCRAVCRGNIFKKGIISSEPTKKDTDRQKVASPGPIIIINICIN
ncbi:hypothetical protein pipiens_011349 [Culex pipiens pipiens]|uniref:Uncharacterized protein n=1 Tax=Culex pipiens pipiens TaxID=38569 RepID=A0ABD1D6Q0_CULPP